MFCTHDVLPAYGILNEVLLGPIWNRNSQRHFFSPVSLARILPQRANNETAPKKIILGLHLGARIVGLRRRRQILHNHTAPVFPLPDMGVLRWK